MAESQQDLLKEILRHPLTWLFSGGGATYLAGQFFGRRKLAADARQVDAGAEITLSKGALEFAQELRKDINAMQERIASLEDENRKLFRRVAELEVDGEAKDRRIEELKRENESLRAEVASLRAVKGA